MKSNLTGVPPQVAVAIAIASLVVEVVMFLIKELDNE